MADVVDPSTRSRMMAVIRGKNTKPEILIRRILHQHGFRFRIHDNKLKGKPDIVLKKYRAIIFVHGCFWHKHSCRLFKWPQTRPDFWRNKIEKNVINDQKAIKELMASGWRICIVWECSIKGAQKNLPAVANKIGGWLKGEKQFMEIEE